MKMAFSINDRRTELEFAWTNERERKFCYLIMGVTVILVAFVKVMG